MQGIYVDQPLSAGAGGVSCSQVVGPGVRGRSAARGPRFGVVNGHPLTSMELCRD